MHTVNRAMLARVTLNVYLDLTQCSSVTSYHGRTNVTHNEEDWFLAISFRFDLMQFRRPGMFPRR